MAVPDQDHQPYRSPGGTFEPVLKAVLEDFTTLTDTEFRFLLYMTTKPPGWRFYTSHLARTTGRRERSIQRLLPSLVRKGYLTKERIREDGGTFTEFFYLLRRRWANWKPRCTKPRPATAAALTSLRAASRASPDQPGAEAGGQQWQ